MSAPRRVSPFLEFDRAEWARLRQSTPLPLQACELDGIRSLGDEIDLEQVRQIYLPLSRLLNLHVQAANGLHHAYETFLGSGNGRSPFVIGLAGSVAVGKSTTARLLRTLLGRWPEHPDVALVTTDGFLLPNAELERRDILGRKGFPESYDRRSLIRFLSAVKAGQQRVSAPLYSHVSYDVSGETMEVARPDVLLIEGLNVLQPPSVRADGRTGLAVSDFIDFSIYVDAATSDIRDWYIQRFRSLRDTAFQDPRSYFRRYAQLSEQQTVQTADRLWREINEPNLVRNILPTRDRASLVLRKGSDHTVRKVQLRKL